VKKEDIPEFERLLHGDEYLRFERIHADDQLHVNITLCGYLKLASLMKHPCNFELSAEHDMVYLPELCELVGEEISGEDLIYLLRCGIAWNDDEQTFTDNC